MKFSALTFNINLKHNIAKFTGYKLAVFGWGNSFVALDLIAMQCYVIPLVFMHVYNP